MKPSGKAAAYSARRSFVLLCIVVLWLSPGAFRTASAADEIAEVNQNTQFQKDAPALGGRLWIAAGMLTVLIIGAGVLLRLNQSGRLPATLGGNRQAGMLRIVEVRRISPRVTVFALEIAGRKSVVIADNGHAMTVVAEWDVQKESGGGA